MSQSKRRPHHAPSLVLATNNAHKVAEIKSILKKAGLTFRVLTLNQFPKRPPVIENKNTIEGNAIKKAREVAKQTGLWALADDTGLFVKALHGRPGVISARFAGAGCTFEDNNNKVLRLLNLTPRKKRAAEFRCIAALASPRGTVLTAEGRISGFIASDKKGTSGFGYDPIFWVPRYKKTFAEMGPRLKNQISHRARAFQKVPLLIKRMTRIEAALL